MKFSQKTSSQTWSGRPQWRNFSISHIFQVIRDVPSKQRKGDTKIYRWDGRQDDFWFCGVEAEAVFHQTGRWLVKSFSKPKKKSRKQQKAEWVKKSGLKKKKRPRIKFSRKNGKKGEKQKLECTNFYFRSCKAVGERCDARHQAHDDTRIIQTGSHRRRNCSTYQHQNCVEQTPTNDSCVE